MRSTPENMCHKAMAVCSWASDREAVELRGEHVELLEHAEVPGLHRVLHLLRGPGA